MKLECNVVGITFRNKEKIFETMRPSGEVLLLRKPFINESDPEKSDPLAVEVWHEGVHLGYVKKGSFAQEFLAENTDIHKASVSGYAYATKEGDKLLFNDDHKGILSMVRFTIEHGDSDVVFDEDNNYIINGIRYARASKVVKYINPAPENDFLDRWKIDTFPSYQDYRKYMAEASRNGTAMHKAIENFVLNGQDGIQIPPGFHNFWKKYSPRVIKTETMVKDDVLGVAGTYDILIDVDEKGVGPCMVLADWKSGKAPSLEHKIKTSWYATQAGAPQAWIVCFGANTKQGYSLCKITGDDLDRYTRLMFLASEVMHTMERK
jgi:cyclophilin family peptidyl-prolyl cis-trans isomerase